MTNEQSGPDNELESSGYRYEGGYHHQSDDEKNAELRVIEELVREIGPPCLLRRNEECSTANRAGASTSWGYSDAGIAPPSGTNSSPIEANVTKTNRSEDALRKRDHLEGLAQLLVGELRRAILSWDHLDKYLQHSIAMDVFTDSFIWRAQDFIREYLLIETQTGRAPTIKLCVAFDTATANQKSGKIEGRILARLMDHTSSTTSLTGDVPAIGSVVERPGSKSLEGPHSLPILVFPKTQEVAIQIVVETIMHRIHPVFQECFPGCHLVSLQPCCVVWNARRSSKAGGELEAALQRARYLRENGQLLHPHKNKKVLCTSSPDCVENLPQDVKKTDCGCRTDKSDLKDALVDVPQPPFASAEFSCAETVPISQDFTVEMSQDFSVNTLTESEFFNDAHATCGSHHRRRPGSLVEAFPLEQVKGYPIPFAVPVPSNESDEADQGRRCLNLSCIFQAVCCFGARRTKKSGHKST